MPNGFATSTLNKLLRKITQTRLLNTKLGMVANLGTVSEANGKNIRRNSRRISSTECSNTIESHPGSLKNTILLLNLCISDGDCGRKVGKGGWGCS